MTPSVLLAGFAAGLGLIVAIGSQNAFVLRQGLLRQHVGPVVAVCALSDPALIGAGVVGLGTLVEAAPAAVDVLRWAGAVFLTAYAALFFRRAWRGGGALTASGDAGRGSVAGSVAVVAVVTQAVALTWLNPHVYLDTVLLLGSIASTYGDARWVFGVGAGLGSIVWFVGLGYGARLLSPLFARPASWRVLDVLVGLTMLVIAVGLVV